MQGSRQDINFPEILPFIPQSFISQLQLPRWRFLLLNALC